MCRRIKSCFNKNSQSQEFNEEIFENKKYKGISKNKKKSVVTLFRNKNMKPNKKDLTDVVDRYSLTGFGNKWTMKSIMDLRERSLFRNLKSRFSLRKGDSSSLSATELKNKFSITGSKEVILNKMLGDYKKGKLDLKDLNKGTEIDLENIDKTKLNKILRNYENKQRTNGIDELLKKSVADLKKKFSMSESEQVALKKMKHDYNKNRLSLSFLKNLSKLDLNKINKDKFHRLLKNYQNKHKNQKVNFVRDSKLEQVRSYVKSTFFDKQ